MPAEMIAASGCDMQRPQHFLILNIAPGYGQELGAETEFAQFARCRIGLDLELMFVNGPLTPFQESRINDASLFDGHQADGAVLEFKRKLAGSARRYVI